MVFVQLCYTATLRTLLDVLKFHCLFSIIGGVTIVIGLYLLLWGKVNDQVKITSEKQLPLSAIEQNEPKRTEVIESQTETCKEGRKITHILPN